MLYGEATPEKLESSRRGDPIDCPKCGRTSGMDFIGLFSVAPGYVTVWLCHQDGLVAVCSEVAES